MLQSLVLALIATTKAALLAQSESVITSEQVFKVHYTLKLIKLVIDLSSPHVLNLFKGDLMISLLLYRCRH